MASNINPNNIDGTYPVAGQDNNSQGFRDNFTNTKTNFQYAENEINDLQTNAILKSALTGTTLDNDMLGSLVYNGVIADFGAIRLALGTVSGSVTIDYSLGHFQTLTTSGSVSLNFTNFPGAGVTGIVSVQVSVASVAHTLTIPAAVSVNTAGIQGINTTTNVITFATTGIYTFQFITSDNGATVTVNEVNQSMSPLNSSSEDLGNGSAANLAVSSSYFTTGTAETASLAAGVAGQVKTFAAVDVASGDMVITVANAGWKSSGTGTITFDGIGQACTLQYINSKWFCIGNNGATFA
jgi:hypothetical protein